MLHNTGFAQARKHSNIFQSSRILPLSSALNHSLNHQQCPPLKARKKLYFFHFYISQYTLLPRPHFILKIYPVQPVPRFLHFYVSIYQRRVIHYFYGGGFEMWGRFYNSRSCNSQSSFIKFNTNEILFLSLIGVT